MTITRDLLNGVAALIVAAVPGTSFNPGSATLPSGIVLKIMPATPDRIIVLNWIPMTDSITMPYGSGILQVATRGVANNPLDVDDVADPIMDALHGLKDTYFGAVHIIQCNRSGGAIPMGQDALVRNERVDKFLIDLDVPATVLRPAGGSW